MGAMPRTQMLRYALVAFLLLGIWFFHPNISGSPHISSDKPHYAPPLKDMQYVRDLLAENEIGPDISFASRKLRYVMDAPERLQNTVLTDQLFAQPFQNVSIKEEFVHSDDILQIHVKRSPRPNKVDASKLMFAASTTPERFNDEKMSPLKEWVRWLTDGDGHTNGALMILSLSKGTNSQFKATEATLRKLGINATVYHANEELTMPTRYMDLIRMMWEHPAAAQKSYFGIVDDDTFFPAPANLIKALEQFNPKKPYYIGAFTERADWFHKNDIPMAYGGAGVFLTLPTIAKIQSSPCLAKLEDGAFEIKEPDGDRFLYQCLTKYTNIALTHLPLLYQFDMFGDPSGFYESGAQPLSLHHFKSWHKFPPALAHLAASACGEDCVFQKFQFSDNFVLSNGYSVQEYPEGVDFDPHQYEDTFMYGGVEEGKEAVVFAHTFGMLRKGLTGTGKKRQWVFIGAVREAEGRVKQVYVKRKGDDRWVKRGEEPLPERDSVVVLTWIP